MKIKFDWGKGIILTIVIFMGISIYTTVMFMNQDVQLVTDEYYEEGLKYQDQIERVRNTSELPESLQIINDGTNVKIVVPELLLQKNISGDILFYRPSDSNKDFKIPLEPDSAGMQIIPSSGLIKGYWKVKILWSAGGENYYTEQAIKIG